MRKTWKQQFKSALAGMLLGILVPTLALGQATLLPNAKQQYLDDAANPVAAGHVDYFVPNTSTRKTVWSDSAKTTPLPNPVILDAAGRPQPTGQIYGDGSYRQRVVDQNNVTIWDAVTTSTGSSSGGTTPASEGVMVGTIIPWANTTLPAKYLYTAGQAISRTTYSDLLTAITYQLNILCQLGVATVTVPTSVSDSVPVGAPVEFSCFTPGTTVLSKASGSLTMSTNATATTSVTGRILPWGNGDGALTFNVPDLRGRVFVGRNNMNGSTGSALSSLYYINGSTPVDPNSVAAVAGNQSHTFLISEMATHSHNNFLTDPGHAHTALHVSNGTGGAADVTVGAGTHTVNDVVVANTTGVTLTNAATGGGVAISATVAAGGSGYAAGTQLLTVSGGTCAVQPQFNVTTAAGAITNPVLVTAGRCSVTPSNPAATTGGGGTGGTLTVSYTALPVSMIQPSVTADYVIKALPDDSPSTPGVTSLGGMTGAIACGAGLTCTANTISVNLAPASVSNTQLAQMPPSTVKMNPTASTASPVDATIDSLVALPVPNPNLDFMFIHDNATNQIKKVNPSQLVTGLGGGVTSLDGAAGAISAGTGSIKVIGSALTTNVFSSRAYASTLNLSGYDSIMTLGYYAPGDGGSAIFKNVGATAFIDSKVLTGTITTGGTCTNGTYLGIPFSGGSGTGFTATVTIAGGVMSAVVPHGTQGQGYTVGNVLTASTSVGGGTATVTCTVAPTWTVATVSAPTGSFTDSAGTHWQITRPPGGVDSRAFGYKNDYTEAGGDAAATDNFTFLTNALNFASTWSVTIPDRGGTQGGIVFLPQFAGMYCGNGNTPLLIPNGVSLVGQGEFSSVIKPCDSWNSNISWVELCDSTTHYSCFGAKLSHMQLYVSPNQDAGSNAAGVAAIYSNNVQDTVIIDHVKIYSGQCRRGIWLEVGYGGTTYNTMQHFGVFGGAASANCGGSANALIFIDYGTTQVKIVDFSGGGFSAGFGGPRDNGLVIDGGFVSIDGYHVEQIVNPIIINIPGSLANGMVSGSSLIGGVDCVGLVTLVGTNTQGNFILRPPMALNGCTQMVTNGQSGGSNFVGPAMNDMIFNP